MYYLMPHELREYSEKAHPMLIGIAKRRTLITYDSLMYKLGCGPGREYSGEVVRKISEEELQAGHPKLSAVVVRGDTKMVGGGFFGLPQTPELVRRSSLAQWRNPELSLQEQEYWHNELGKVYDYWCPEFH
jgi:hypothetical protein